MNQHTTTRAYVQRNQYQDSVALMRVAQRLLALPGVRNATLLLGSAANKEILAAAGLMNDTVADAGPADIMVVLQAGNAEQSDAALAAARDALSGQAGAGATVQGAEEVPASSLAMGHARAPGANLAQISVPGPYAAAEALKAVSRGLNVFLFSDNVPLAQEAALKREAQRRGVLVMGPDCGTALLGGVPLGFANNVRSGSIGLVAASGTGLQEVMTQIHRLGGGISHAIGTGGRDLHADVGAVTMCQGIRLLAADAATRVIVVVSKPPAPALLPRVMAALREAGKPAVVLFIGAPAATGAPAGTVFVDTLVDAAAAAVRRAGVARTPSAPYALPARPRFASSQRDLRALYSGGTFAAEALALWARSGLAVRSNVPLDKSLALADARQPSTGHVALDLGDDAFTVGRPHPMIDQATRIERLHAEAADPATRVLLLDVVIGHGAHDDPAGELAPHVQRARAAAARGGRHLAVIGFVCGTEDDPQRLSAQEATLRRAGVVLAGNSANAAWLAGQWVR